MNVLLITGLDGCGKSTLIGKLEEYPSPQKVGFLRVPMMATDKISGTALKQVANAVNSINAGADRLGDSRLKAIALFCSMLLFSDLLSDLENQGMETIICERHPLIDTAVYAEFYSDKMKPGPIPAAMEQIIDQLPEEQLELLLKKIPGLPPTAKKLLAISEFMYQVFGKENTSRSVDLKNLFKVEPPDHIYYLAASPQTLYQRLYERKLLEPHESVSAFSQMIPVYDRVLSKTKAKVERIDANGTKNLDDLFESLVKKYF